MPAPISRSVQVGFFPNRSKQPPSGGSRPCVLVGRAFSNWDGRLFRASLKAIGQQPTPRSSPYLVWVWRRSKEAFPPYFGSTDLLYSFFDRLGRGRARPQEANTTTWLVSFSAGVSMSTCARPNLFVAMHARRPRSLFVGGAGTDTRAHLTHKRNTDPCRAQAGAAAVVGAACLGRVMPCGVAAYRLLGLLYPLLSGYAREERGKARGGMGRQMGAAHTPRRFALSVDRPPLRRLLRH